MLKNAENRQRRQTAVLRDSDELITLSQKDD